MSFNLAILRYDGLMKAIGYDFGQGYFFARPVPALAFETLAGVNVTAPLL